MFCNSEQGCFLEDKTTLQLQSNLYYLSTSLAPEWLGCWILALEAEILTLISGSLTLAEENFSVQYNNLKSNQFQCSQNWYSYQNCQKKSTCMQFHAHCTYISISLPYHNANIFVKWCRTMKVAQESTFAIRLTQGAGWWHLSWHSRSLKLNSRAANFKSIYKR